MRGFVERHRRLIVGVLLAVFIVAALALLLYMLSLLGVHPGTGETALTWEKDLHTSDGRIVHCLANEYGMSCDWEHATVAQ